MTNVAGRQRLGVVFGGRSVEHEVSVVSAMNVLEAADPDRFEAVPFGVTRDGRWLTPEETRAQLARADKPYEKRLDADIRALLQRTEVPRELEQLDCLFPLVHRVHGEDGPPHSMVEKC